MGMQRKDLQAEVCYYAEDTDQYIVSPDGVGVYVYETLEEVHDEHGDLGRTVVIDYLEDY